MSIAVSPRSDLSPRVVWLISLFFWLVLGLAAALAALLVLAPRIAESEELRLQYAANRRQLRHVASEIQHLEQVAAGLEFDADFRKRVISSELHARPAGSERIPVGASLGYDPRIPNLPVSKSSPDESLLLNWIRPIAEPTAVRSRLNLAAFILLIFAFGCLNESFFSGSIGQAVLWGLGGICNRYRRPAAKGAGRNR